MAETCKRAYGEQRYAPSPYGSGDYDGLMSATRDIILYYPDANGQPNFDAPITYIPPADLDRSTVFQIPDLTPLGEGFFSDIKKLRVGHVYTTYHKVWLFNANQDYDFTSVSIELDPAFNTDGFISIAESVVNAPIPLGDEVNCGRGYGPGEFDIVPVPLGDIPKQGAASFWVRRRVVGQSPDPMRYDHAFIIRGTTVAEGVLCTPTP